MLRFPLVFERNLGQAREDSQFVARGPLYDLALEKDRTVIALRRGKVALTLQVAGAAVYGAIRGEDRLPGHSNYYLGSDRSRWITDVPQFGRVITGDVYPGIDLVQYGKAGELEWDFVVHPGAEPARIRIQATGHRQITIADDGDAVLQLLHGEVRLKRPRAHQDGAGGNPVEVPVRFALAAHGQLGFVLGAYDHKRELVIDPVLNFSTFLTAATNFTIPVGMRIDSGGNMYIVGAASAAGYPLVSSLQGYSGSFDDVVISKISAGGTILFSTYFGGSDEDSAQDLTLDGSDNLYIVGNSDSTNFPTTPGAYLPACSQVCNTPFAAKFSSSGALVYSTFLGPSNANALAASVLSDGSLLLGGVIDSQDLPLVNAIDSTPPTPCTSCSKGFLQRLSADGGSLLFSTYFKSPIGRISSSADSFFAAGQDLSLWKITNDGQSILSETRFAVPSAGEIVGTALDNTGGLVLTGNILGTDFPYTPDAVRAACASSDITTCNYTTTVFLMRTDSSGALTYASAVVQGRAGPDLQTDAAGNVFLTGGTNQPMATINPIQNSLHETRDASQDAFVIKLNASGQPVFATFLGGGNTLEVGNSVRVDAAGNIYVLGGISQSINDVVDYPLLHPVQVLPSCCTVYGMFVARIAPGDGPLLIATPQSMVGGRYTLRNLGSASVVITGVTAPVGTGITTDCVGTLPGGGMCNITVKPQSAFVNVSVLTTSAGTYTFSAQASSGPSPAISATPHSPLFPPTMIGGTSPVRTVTVKNLGTDPANSLTISIPGGSTEFHQTNNCPTTLNALAFCSISVTASPQAAGVSYAQLAVNSTDPNSETVYLSASGVSTAFAASVPSISFGRQTVGAALPARAFELTNATSSPISITGVAASPAAFTATANCTSVAPGATCRGTAAFTPIQNGSLTGTITFTHNGPGAALTVPLFGMGAINSGLALSDFDLTFSALLGVNPPQQQVVTLTNVSADPITLGSITAPSAYATSTDCGVPIAVGASCNLTITYQPTVPGTDVGEVLINHSGIGTPQNVNVSGTARTPLTFGAASVDFGQIVVGASSDPVLVSINNNSTTPVSISNITISPGFSILQNPCPSTLPGYFGCVLQLLFTPSDYGALSGSLTVTASDYGQPHVLPLSGTGITGTLFTVVSPAGGERWVIGTAHTIQWTYSGADPGPTVNLELSGFPNTPIASGISVGSGGSGSFAWTLPDSIYPSDGYRVRVSSVSHPEYHNVSAGTFEIVAAPRITVQFPNGGESYDVGTTQVISWLIAGDVGASFKIELLSNGAAVQLIAANAPNNGGGVSSFFWSIPADLAPGSYKIRVTSNASPGVFDDSDGAFSITLPAFLALSTPNGGEVWTAGTTQNITWRYSHNLSGIRIELLEAGVVTQVISSSAPLGTDGNGSYAWAIPPGLAPASDYRVRITSTANAAYTSTSAANFQIISARLTVRSPNGGEVWSAGTTQTLRWTYTGSPGNVKIELLKGGTLNSTISSSTTVGTSGSGSFSWLIPSSTVLGDNYRVRITSLTTPTATDTSDADFRINHIGIAVKAPNGGENWYVGTTQSIRWIWSGSVGSFVKIELLKSGVLNRTITSSAAIGSGGSGSFSWAIPGNQTAGSDYRIRITSTTNSGVTDTSDADFTIQLAPVAPTAVSVTPSSGSGTSQTFSFLASDTGGANKITYVQALINGSFAWQNACAVLYYQSTNRLYLVLDSGTGWQGPLTPGQAGTLSNSQCTLDGGASSVSAVGNNLTVNAALTFKPAFTGSKTVFLDAEDVPNSLSSGFQALGSWTVP